MKQKMTAYFISDKLFLFGYTVCNTVKHQIITVTFMFTAKAKLKKKVY